MPFALHSWRDDFWETDFVLERHKSSGQYCYNWTGERFYKLRSSYTTRPAHSAKTDRRNDFSCCVMDYANWSSRRVKNFSKNGQTLIRAVLFWCYNRGSATDRMNFRPVQKAEGLFHFETNVRQFSGRTKEMIATGLKR